MAKIKRVFLSGAIDNLIFYDRKGTPCARRKPAKVRQTAATKRSAKLFGKAVGIAKYLRWGLKSALPGIGGRYAEYKLNAGVAEALSSISASPKETQAGLSGLSGLQLNQATSLVYRLKVSVKADWSVPGQVTLKIPAMNPVNDIKAIVGTKRVHWKVAVAGSYVTGSSMPAMLQRTSTWTMRTPICPHGR